MQFALAVVAVNVLCVFASPTPHPLLAATQEASYTQKSSSSSTSYFQSDICSEQSISIRKDISTSIYQSSEKYFYQARCNFLNTFSYWPENYGPQLWDGSYTIPQYDAIFIGATESTFATLETLINQQLKIAIIDRSTYWSQEVFSIYQRPSLYSSDYVIPYKGLLPGSGNIYKNVYATSIFGGASVLGYNEWMPTPSFVFDNDYVSINDAFTSSYVSQSFEKFVSYSSSTYGSSTYSQSSTTVESSTVSSSSSGYVSIYDSYSSYESTTLISNLAQELNYNLITGNTFGPGYYKLPMVGSNGVPEIYANTVFKRLQKSQYFSNIHLYLETEAHRLIIENNVATGIEVISASSQQTQIFSNCKNIILTQGPLSLSPLLLRSGIGSAPLLQQLGITPTYTLPDITNSFYTPAIYPLVFKFPKSSICGSYSDSAALRYAIGDYSVSSFSSLMYQKYLLAVNGASNANVRLHFHSFSSFTQEYSSNYFKYIFQFDESVTSYLNGYINDYDLLVVSSELLDIRSKTILNYGSSLTDISLQYNFYQDEYELQCMLESISTIRKFISTKAFSQYQPELLQLPVPGYTGDFTDDYFKAALFAHSVPFGPAIGGYPYGIDASTSVVDKYFNFHGVSQLRLCGSSIATSSLYGSNFAFNTFMSSYFAENFNQVVSTSSVSTANGVVAGGSSYESSQNSLEAREVGSRSASYNAASGRLAGGYGASSQHSSSEKSQSSLSSNQQSTLVSGPGGTYASKSSNYDKDASYSKENHDSNTVVTPNGAYHSESDSSVQAATSEHASSSSTVAAY